MGAAIRAGYHSRSPPFLARRSDTMADLPTGTVTLLFTDIEGSTRLWEAHAAAMRAALARHDALLRHCIDDHDGHVFKTGGDAFCAAFHTASDALAAALDAQRALHREPWPEGAKLRVRMALHSGAVELRDGDYFGAPLNRVARLLAAGHGGQTLLSESTHDLCRDHLPPLASVKALGAHGLKDLGRPEAVFQLCHPDLPQSFPPLKSQAAPPDKETPSIAVLPFVNMSRDEENEYFADGLSEELLNVLAKIRGLRVASRTSAFSFKGKDVDIPTVAQKLNVATVLEGSVRKSGKRVRITAQLIEVASDSHLWSETYDRELDDIFAVQDDIAQSVVKELRAALMGAPAEPAASTAAAADVRQATTGRSDNPEAFQLYLQGKFFGERTTQADTRQGDRSVQAGAGDRARISRWRGRDCRGSTRRRRGLALRRSTKASSAPARPRSARCASRRTLAEGHIALGHDPGSQRLGLAGGRGLVSARAGACARRRPRAARGGRPDADPGPARRGARADPQGDCARSAVGAHASPGRDDLPDGGAPRRRGGVVSARARPRLRAAACTTHSWRSRACCRGAPEEGLGARRSRNRTTSFATSPSR